MSTGADSWRAPDGMAAVHTAVLYAQDDVLTSKCGAQLLVELYDTATGSLSHQQDVLVQVWVGGSQSGTCLGPGRHCGAMALVQHHAPAVETAWVT
jgi:hypothetical protein